MKVLYVEASAGAVVGGSLTGLLHLVAGLDREKVQPSLVLFEDKPMVASLKADGVPVYLATRRKLPKEHALQSAKGFQAAKKKAGLAMLMQTARRLLAFAFETLPSAFGLLSILRASRPDLVHVCNGFRGNLDAILAARLAGVPCVVHNKGFDKLSFLEQAASQGVAASLSMTKAIEAHCRKGGLKPKTWLVSYDGIDPASFEAKREPAAVRKELGLAEGAPVVGVVGNIQEWKGQIVLVEALALIRDRFPTLVAVIVGGIHASGGDYAALLRRRVEELSLTERVLFTGARDDVPDMMRALDVVVHTSVRGEPFGRVIIEAMSVGRPVIATRAGGVPEFVQDGQDGLLVEPGSAEALAEALTSLLGDSARYETLKLGATKAAERFTIARHVQEVTSLYETLLGEAR